jgi:hypothetical protein
VRGFLALLLLCNAAVGAEPAMAAKVDIAAAQKMLDAGKPMDALRLVSPCLRPEAVTTLAPAQLEECLYVGQHIQFGLINFANRDAEREDAAFVQSVRALGVPIQWQHHFEAYYSADPVFFKELRRRFPASQRADEVEYALMDWGEEFDWKTPLAGLSSFLQKFPNSTLVQGAKIDMAQIYFELWENARPGKRSDEFDFRSAFGLEFGSDEANAKAAEEFRQKSIALYTEALKMKPGRKMSQLELESYRDQLEDIQNKRSPGFARLYSD